MVQEQNYQKNYSKSLGIVLIFLPIAIFPGIKIVHGDQLSNLVEAIQAVLQVFLQSNVPCLKSQSQLKKSHFPTPFLSFRILDITKKTIKKTPVFPPKKSQKRSEKPSFCLFPSLFRLAPTLQKSRFRLHFEVSLCPNDLSRD